MKTLLKIQASLFGEQGQSTKLADRLVDQWLQSNPDGRVISRDLSESPVPHLTAARFQALNAKPAERTAAQQAVVNFSDALIRELQQADRQQLRRVIAEALLSVGRGTNGRST